MTEVTHRVDQAIDRAADVMTDKIAEVKPKLRGWLHAACLPLLTSALTALIVLSPTALTRAGAAVYAASAVALFTVSAIYHRGTWSPGLLGFWRRLDHANIFVYIAGSNTPFALLYLGGESRWWLLGTVWGCALAGVIFKIWWMDAPRWLCALLYIGVGWVGILFLPQLIEGGQQFSTSVNVAVVGLIATGGVLYMIGAIVYARQRPDPFPAWFGFHEVFHLCTVLASIAHYTAISVLTYSLR